MEPPKKPPQKRAAQACTSCRRKKIRCDGGSPRCINCRTFGTECEYTAGLRRGDQAVLQQQLDRMEHTLQVIMSRLPQSSMCSSPQVMRETPVEEEDDCDDDDDEGEAIGEFGANRIRPTPVDDALYYHGLGWAGWSAFYKQYMGGLVQQVDYAQLMQLRSSFSQLSVALSDSIISADPNFSHPDMSPELMSQISVYLDRLMENDTFSMVIDAKELKQIKANLNMSYSSYTGDLLLFSSVVALAVVHQTRKLDMLFNVKPEDPLLKAAMRCFRVAFRQALNLAIFQPNFTILRGTLLVLVCSLYMWMPPTLQVYLSRRSMEICEDLGLNRQSFYRHLDSETAARYSSVFWGCYICNRNVSLRVGCAPYNLKIYVEPIKAPSHTSDLYGIAKGVELFRIYESIYDDLCSGEAERRSARTIVRNVLALDAKLEEWWDDLDPAVRATNVNITKKNFPAQSDSFCKDHMAFAICNYYILTMAIHRMCAFAPATIHKHLQALYPIEYEAACKGKKDPNNPNYKRVWRLLHSMEISANAGRYLVKLCIFQTRMDMSYALLLGDVLNTSSSMMIKALFLPDAKSLDDAQLIREAVECMSHFVCDRNSFPWKAMEEILTTTATIIETKVLQSQVNTQRPNEGPVTNAQHLMDQLAQHNNPPHADPSVPDTGPGAYYNETPDRPMSLSEAQNFETLLTELFPDLDSYASGYHLPPPWEKHQKGHRR